MPSREPISFVARTIPVAKARARSFRYRDKVTGETKFGHHAAAKTDKAESEFIALADPHAPPVPFDGPIRIDIVFVMPIPISGLKWWREAAAAGAIYPRKKPDRDNLEKLVLDALTRSGRWWIDDNQVVAGASAKIYGVAPETRVTITELPEPTREQWLGIKDRPIAAAQAALF